MQKTGNREQGTVKPVCIDLYCGLGGWSEGFLAEGYECIGYDIEAHDYGSGGYPGTLMLRDVRSIHGSEFKDATCIVASPPCQEPSYRAMCWKIARALHPKTVGISEPEWWAIPENANKNQRGMTPEELSEWRQYQLDYPLPPPTLFMELFNECFRIQREASEAAGHYIPLIIENVRGAQKWVGRAQWHYGSFYLWGDVPALMPTTLSGVKADGSGWTEKGSLVSHNRLVSNQPQDGYKTAGMNWSNRELHGQDFTRIAGKQAEGVKVGGSGAAWWREPLQAKRREATAIKNGGDWFGSGENCSEQRKHGSKSSSRKAASAMIAKIPFALAQHFARTFKPQGAFSVPCSLIPDPCSQAVN